MIGKRWQQTNETKDKQKQNTQKILDLRKICLNVDGLATLYHRYSRATLYPWNLISVHFQYVLLKIMCSEMHNIPSLPLV